MSLVKQIQNKGAVSCWSPQINFPNLIALGTKESAGSGFEDHGGEIEIHELKFADPSLESICKGKLRASSRFTSIAWSPMTAFVEQFHLGLIAGGMIDGIVNIWNPHLIVENVDDALLVSLEQHQGSVTAVDFNPHKESTHLLATGGSDGEVYVISLDNLEMPTVFIPAPNTVKHTADITQVKWNTQVAHILASSSQNGSCFVWDLRQKRAWCELRDPMGGSVSDIAWNPDQGLHIITASGDDRHPVLKLWDLRSSTSLPLATLSGHTEGILSIDWCPHDTSLLISCGKDSKTFLWDLFQLQPVYELPTQQFNGVSEEVNIFTSIASTASHRKYRASWSPCIPAVLSTSSFDRRIQFHSMTGFRSKPAKAPKWLRRNVSASFGFGGKLVVIDNIPNAAGKKTPVSVKIHVHQVVENFEVVNQSDEFHSSVAKGSYSDVCSVKSKTSDPDHRDVWELMRVICFGKNAREELLSFLGFDSSVISDDAKSCHTSIASSSSSSSLEEMIASIQASHQSKLTKLINFVELAGAAEPTVRKSLIVGNFDMAVECCLASGLLAEALLLAQCGGPELKAKTQAAFFEKQRQEYSFLNVLHAVIKNQLSEYVRNSDLSAWKETLALLSTYGKSEEFPSLCETLAGRLEEERNNKKAAALCYMCAANVARTIHFWVDELISANNRLGQLDVSALQDFVEKVVIFTHANPVDDLGEDCGRFFAEYATILANQGRLSSAANYLKGDSTPIKVLADRIYHAGSKPAGSRPPVFPFDRANVESNPLTLEHKSKVVTQGITPVKSDTTKLSMIPSTPVQKQENTVIAPSQTSVPNAGITSRLPAGWVQLVDPQSNRVYFANQTTGHSQWEPPDFPAESVSFESKVFMQTSEVPASLEISETPKLNQSDATRSNEFDCVIALGQMIEAIAALNLSAPEKKQVTMLRSNFQILLEKMKNEELSPEIMEKLSLFTDALVNRNYSGASLIQTDLTNTAWSQHKEWLKGLKILIQLAIKK